jgi:NAD(P)-dependent dehydrogenase (short-subunit alcohol dehydrogenase family)
MGIALVTGASRGVGRGVAAGLSAAGFRVFATGRTVETAELPPGIVRIRCDHTDDAETANLFDRIATTGEPLAVLVNCAWGGYERMIEDGQYTWTAPFWQQPAHRWSSMMNAGVRAAFVASAGAARLMIPRGGGFIVNISYWAAQKHLGNAIYGIAKAASDKMSSDMAVELREHSIAVVSLYPGLVRTEAVMAAAQNGWLDISNSESPEFIGRVVAALSADPGIMQRSGSVLVAAEVALELGVTDVDGTQPRPLTLETA